MFGRYKDFKPKDIAKELERKLKFPFYWGFSYQCSACEANIRRFKPIWKSFPRRLKESGFVYRLDEMETFNADAFLCPSCNCSDRERLYALYLRKWLAQKTPQRTHVVVDFAPSHALSKWLRTVESIQYRSADLFRRNVDDKVDITDMPDYKSDSIDAFICSHVLEHVTNDRAAMRELYRILKPGGFGIVMVPLIVGVTETHEDETITSPDDRWRYFGQDDHVRLYGTADFVTRLVESGFDVVQLGIKHFGVQSFHRAGIAENSVLYVARKCAPAGSNQIVEFAGPTV